MIKPWTPEEASALERTAKMELTRHNHYGTSERLVRENCGACVLRDAIDGDFVAREPNYAGWARIMVQAGLCIAPSLLEMELQDENLQYVGALRRDLATWPQVTWEVHSDRGLEGVFPTAERAAAMVTGLAQECGVRARIERKENGK